MRGRSSFLGKNKNKTKKLQIANFFLNNFLNI